MPQTPLDFERMLFPVTPQQFFRDYWDQRHLAVARNEPLHYEGLPRLQDVDAMVACSPPDPHDRTLQDDVASPIPLRVADTAAGMSSVTEGRPNLAPLYASYCGGNTLTLNNAQLRWPPLAAFCAALEDVLNHAVAANLYLTPPSAQGLKAHYDTHDIFILQLSGSKVWRLYRAAVDLPLPGLSEELNRPHTEFLEETELRAGDLLYLPRGVVHEAKTTEQHSLHLTVGVHTCRWMDLAVAAITALSRQDLRMRRALPPGFLQRPELLAELGTKLADWMRDAAAQVSAAAAVEELKDMFIDTHLAVPDGHFERLGEVGGVHLDTVAVRRPGMLCRVFTSGERAFIKFPGNRIRGPAFIEPLLRFIAGAERFRVRDLPSVVSDPGKLVLVRRLIREGLLTIVTP